MNRKALWALAVLVVAAGARADVVALDPRDASVRAVWLGGCEVRR